jgi:hypothetical protein
MNQRGASLAAIAVVLVAVAALASLPPAARADTIVRTPLQPFGLIALEQYPHCDPSSGSTCPASDAVLANAAQNPAISGLMIRVTWKDMEPSYGTINWSITDPVFNLAEKDSSVAQPRPGLSAHKFVVLSFVPGFETPMWALSDPAGKLPAAATGSFCIPYGIGAGTTATLPLPWDPTYLSNWSNFLQQISSHYASKSDLLMIAADGPTSISEEMSLPGAAGPASSCNESADIATWKSLGYTPSVYEAAWNTVFQSLRSEFASQYASFAYYRGLPVPGAAQRTDVPADVASEGKADLGNDFAIEANGLTYKSPDDGAYKFVASYSGTGAATGFEMATAATTNPANMLQEGGKDATTAAQALQNALDAGVAANVDFLEIYHEDADAAASDSSVMAVLQSVAGELPLPQYSPAYAPPFPRPSCHGSSCT